MTFWTTRTHRRSPSTSPACAGCDLGLAHCHETLVLHADGTSECEGHPTCDLDPAGHDLWLACSALDACGCTGDDHDLPLDLPLAA